MVEKTPDSKGRVPTSIKIDSNLWKEAKIEAINRNIDLSEMVEHALRKEIGKESVSANNLRGGKLRGGKL
ncbi:hypothetical protein [Candidatus Nitrosocosmicus arcticus]|uniref:Uncharacterized protein n=1 Tax=Candidatus Nitrosocosmicus arcticus TaxID=2035267 RepID=A0A557SVA6_9ARCH|nr:hypothetical protein [Candidatus Nitrosocosmicus arcticus]TVP40535.1 hypothetical protein NARC_70116 [Candidatus Nitrosocosmicus arcticus]